MNYTEVLRCVYDARKIAFDKTLKNRVRMKGDADFVTEVDVSISNFIKERLRLIAPEAAFVTEEEDEHISSGKRFILDPIDGTTNLVRGYRMSSISLGYIENDEVQFGAVYSPFTQELFFAVKGCGAHLFNARNGIESLAARGVENYRGNPLKVSGLPHEQAIIEFGAGSTNKACSAESFETGKRIFDECLDLRRICSTALSICFIAAGRIDGYYERKIKPWDYAAASLILEEAGGKLSQWNGEKLPFDRASTIAAGNADVHGYLRHILGDKQ